MQSVSAVTVNSRRSYPRKEQIPELHPLFSLQSTLSSRKDEHVCWDTRFASLVATSSDLLATGIISNTKYKLVEAEKCH